MRINFTSSKIILLFVFLTGCCEKGQKTMDLSYQASTVESVAADYPPTDYDYSSYDYSSYDYSSYDYSSYDYPSEELEQGEYEYGGHIFKARDGFTINDELVLRRARRRRRR